MIDLILQGTKANIAALLRNRGLLDADNNPVPGCDLAWWAGDGKFMTAAGDPPTYMTGFVVVCRIHSEMFESDRLDGQGEQWARSKIARWIKDNGVLGSIGGIPCYTINSVRLFRAGDVGAWLETHGLPGHEWFGGNEL